MLGVDSAIFGFFIPFGVIDAPRQDLHFLHAYTFEIGELTKKQIPRNTILQYMEGNNFFLQQSIWDANAALRYYLQIDKHLEQCKHFGFQPIP